MSPLDEILGQSTGNLLLKCKDGELLVHKDILTIASRKVAKYLESKEAWLPPELSVSTDTVAQWKLVLGQLYPICPRPELELEEIIQVLGIANEWELAMCLSYVSAPPGGSRKKSRGVSQFWVPLSILLVTFCIGIGFCIGTGIMHRQYAPVAAEAKSCRAINNFIKAAYQALEL
eukprot:gene13412-19263_t